MKCIMGRNEDSDSASQTHTSVHNNMHEHRLNLTQPSHNSSIRTDEGLTLETSAFQISVRWLIYIINSVDKPNFRILTFALFSL